MGDPSSSNRLLSVSAVIGRTSLSRTTLWRLTRRGAFPAPIQISPNRVAWLERSVDAWIESKVSA